jgi:hypothetical protein
MTIPTSLIFSYQMEIPPKIGEVMSQRADSIRQTTLGEGEVFVPKKKKGEMLHNDEEYGLIPLGILFPEGRVTVINGQEVVLKELEYVNSRDGIIKGKRQYAVSKDCRVISFRPDGRDVRPLKGSPSGDRFQITIAGMCCFDTRWTLMGWSEHFPPDWQKLHAGHRVARCAGGADHIDNLYWQIADVNCAAVAAAFKTHERKKIPVDALTKLPAPPTRRAAGDFDEGRFSFASSSPHPAPGFAGFTLSFGSPTLRTAGGFAGGKFSFGSPTRGTASGFAESEDKANNEVVTHFPLSGAAAEPLAADKQADPVHQQQTENLQHHQQSDHIRQDHANHLQLQVAAELQAIEQTASRAIEPVSEEPPALDDIRLLPSTDLPGTDLFRIEGPVD